MEDDYYDKKNVDEKIIVDLNILKPGKMQTFLLDLARKYQMLGKQSDARILLSLDLASRQMIALTHGLGDQMSFNSQEKMPRQHLDLKLETPTSPKKPKKSRKRNLYDGF